MSAPVTNPLELYNVHAQTAKEEVSLFGVYRGREFVLIKTSDSLLSRIWNQFLRIIGFIKTDYTSVMSLHKTLAPPAPAPDTSEIDALRRDLETLRGQLQEKERSHATALQQAQDELAVARAEIEPLRAQLDGHASQLKQKEQEHEDTLKQLSNRVKDVVKKHKAEMAQLKAEIAQKDARISELEAPKQQPADASDNPHRSRSSSHHSHHSSHRSLSRGSSSSSSVTSPRRSMSGSPRPSQLAAAGDIVDAAKAATQE